MSYLTPTNKPVVTFKYLNEWGNTTELTIELDDAYLSPFDAMREAFAKFMIACGYSTELVKNEIFEDL